MVSGEVGVVEQLGDHVERFIWAAADIEVLRVERHWLDIDH
jgi:hypothetical protein